MTYYKAVVIMTLRIWHKDQQTSKEQRAENQTYTYIVIGFKGAKAILWGRKVFLTSAVGKTGYAHSEWVGKIQSLPHTTQTNSFEMDCGPK